MSKQIKTIADLTPDPANANAGTERGRYMVGHSLSEFGAGRSILVDKNGVVIAGNKTLEAAAELGLDVEEVHTDGNKLVVVVRDDLDLMEGDRARQLAYADNRASEVGLQWDVERLLADAKAMDLSGMFKPGEVEAIAAKAGLQTGGNADAEPQVDRAEELRVKWGVETGQLWRLGEHRLLCGDSTRAEDVARVMGGEKADMVFTDPPYGVNVSGKGGNAIAGDISFTAIPLMFKRLPEAIADKAWIYICGGQSNMSLYSRMFEEYFRQLPRVIVWDKGNTAVMRRNGWHSCYEFVYFTFLEGSGDRWFTGRSSEEADDVWRERAPSGSDRVHITEKPISIPERAIRATCPPVGIVFEPFCGSASTLIACENLKRKCRAIEISPAYVAVALERFFIATNKRPELISGK